MRPYATRLLIGVALALIVCAIITRVPSPYSVDFLAAFLALTAAAYFGSALSDGRPRVFLVETLVGLSVFATALAGVWVSTVWLAVGYFAHGLWDVFHHPHRVGAPVTLTWFPPVCLTFDWIVGAFILVHL